MPLARTRFRIHAHPSVPFLLVAAIILRVASTAQAIERSCGPDPVDNTASVLCAPPSGPCSDSLVVVSTNVTARGGGCDFDLGGRALRIERTIRVPGDDGDTLHGRMVFDNVADVTIARRAKLKARGDFIPPAGKIIGGGLIGIESAGRIDVLGTIDGSGENGAGMYLYAHGDITLDARSRIRGRGITSFREEEDLADGGNMSIQSWEGGVVVDGDIDLSGGTKSFGGEIEILAARDVVVHGTIEASGTLGGGFIALAAADDVRMDGSVVAASRSGGGMGGEIDLDAGDGTLGPPFVPPDGAKVRGDAIVAGLIDVRGSGDLQNDPGSGGSVAVLATGTVSFAAAATIRADAGSAIPGSAGGDVTFTAGEGQTVPPFSDGDVELAGLVSARGNGNGGSVDVDAVRDVMVTGVVDVSGGDEGGFFQAAGGRDMTFSGTAQAGAMHATGAAGVIRGFAGRIEYGTLAITADLDAAVGSKGECSRVHMSSCSLTVAVGVTLDGSCGGIGVGHDPHVIRLLGRNTIELGAGSRYLAGPAESIALVHPPGVIPTIGAGVLFTPDPIDVEDADAGYPVCGAG